MEWFVLSRHNKKRKLMLCVKQSKCLRQRNVDICNLLKKKAI